MVLSGSEALLSVRREEQEEGWGGVGAMVFPLLQGCEPYMKLRRGFVSFFPLLLPPSLPHPCPCEILSPGGQEVCVRACESVSV